MVRKIDNELAPFRDGSEELLEGRVSDVQYFLKDLECDNVNGWWESNQRLCELESEGRLQELLLGLGYSLQNVQSKYFRDGVVEMYSRGEGSKDNFVIGRNLMEGLCEESINDSGFFYVHTSEKEQKVLEDNLPYIIVGNQPNLRYRVENYCNLGSVSWSIVGGGLLLTDMLLMFRA